MTTDRVDQLFDEAATGIAADLAADGGPLTVPVKGACLLLGYSLSHLRRLVTAGKLESPVPGQITAQSIAAMLRERMAKSPYREAQSRLMAERARIAEIKRRELEASLIEATAVNAAVESMVEVVRAAVLAIPSKVAPQAAAANDPRAVAAILADEIEHTLNALADTKVELVEPAH